MRIALLFSGQPRYINECESSIRENLIDPNVAAGHKIDIFGHFWWDSSYIGKSFKFHAADIYERDEVENFKEKYSPKLILAEPQESFDISGYNLVDGEQSQELSPHSRELWSREVVFKQISMWESVKRSYEVMRKHDVSAQYNIVVRLRTDLLFTKPLKFSKLPIPLNGVAIDDFENKSQLCDWFAYGNQESMRKYCSLGQNAIKILSCMKVVRSTTLLRDNIASWGNGFNLQVENLGVNIYRGYKVPVSMQQHEMGEARPYWMEK